ncbi:MAG TPA: hypothetical protein VFY36_02150 [Solirubrobacteraceae bacterium]|nr:hypothetical protein [Solirubrobacteraceae bacterium]
MRRTIKIKLCFAAVFAISGLAATAASAEPEFLHEGKEVLNKGFVAKSKAAGATLVELGETKYKIFCTSRMSTGKIKGKSEVDGVVVKFKGCRAKEAGEALECEVNSTNPLGAKEEVITKTLKGRIGLVVSAEATSERGLLLLPNVGTVYVTIKGSTECLPAETSEVKGSLMGEIKPVHTLKLKSELFYKTKEQKTQLIKKFIGESATHELEIFEVKAPVEAADTIEYEESVEIT